MGRADQSTLLRHPISEGKEYMRLTSADAGWDKLNFAARRMTQGDIWTHNTQDSEFVLVVVGGKCGVKSNHDNWLLGRRKDVFSGMPYSLYLPPHTQFNLSPSSAELDIAYGWCYAEGKYPPVLITPDQVSIEIRGGENVTRQINNIIPPGSYAEHLVAVEVYTPSGNWSSYPPHKHDKEVHASDGGLVEADLEEVYFYKFHPRDGFAWQRVYTDDLSLDELIMTNEDDLVIVPRGYHPVVSAPGYTTYYLNFLAGSEQSLKARDDPHLSWVKKTWVSKDPRLPFVYMGMESEDDS